MAGVITTQGRPYAQLMVASAVAIDVAIVATHLNTEIKTFLVTFILLFLFTYGFYGLYGFFTIHYSLLPYLVSLARYG